MSIRQDDDGVIHLPGGGPACPKCGGPTYRVASDDATQP